MTISILNVLPLVLIGDGSQICTLSTQTPGYNNETYAIGYVSPGSYTVRDTWYNAYLDNSYALLNNGMVVDIQDCNETISVGSAPLPVADVAAFLIQSDR